MQHGIKPYTYICENQYLIMEEMTDASIYSSHRQRCKSLASSGSVEGGGGYYPLPLGWQVLSKRVVNRWQYQLPPSITRDILKSRLKMHKGKQYPTISRQDPRLRGAVFQYHNFFLSTCVCSKYSIPWTNASACRSTVLRSITLRAAMHKSSAENQPSVARSETVVCKRCS